MTLKNIRILLTRTYMNATLLTRQKELSWYNYGKDLDMEVLF